MIKTSHGVIMIHHNTIEIPENREAEADHFYGGVLGLKKTEIPHTLRGHEHGGIWYEVSPDGLQQVHLGPVPNFQAQKRGHMAFFIHRLSALRETFVQAGVQIEEAVPEPGWQRFYARDPFGTRLEFREQL